MSFHSHSNTPAVIASPVATSPKYSMSGIANEINRSKSQNGYMSTLFGRSTYGTADRKSNAYHQSTTESIATGMKPQNRAAKGASIRQLSGVFGK